MASESHVDICYALICGVALHDRIEASLPSFPQGGEVAHLPNAWRVIPWAVGAHSEPDITLRVRISEDGAHWSGGPVRLLGCPWVRTCWLAHRNVGSILRL
jgi:hypothetical protein